MKDLIEIAWKGKSHNLSDSEISKNIKLELFRELKQMDDEEFCSIVSSVSVDAPEKEYQIVLRISY